LPRFCSIAVSGLFESSIRLPYCPIFLAVRPYGGVYSPLGQLPRLTHATGIRLGVRCERKSMALVFGLARKPLLLFCHHRGIRPKKGKSVESTAHSVITPRLSHLHLVDDLPRLVEALQGKEVIAEIHIQRNMVGHKSIGSLGSQYVIGLNAVNCQTGDSVAQEQNLRQRFSGESHSR
jgi:hypothetical protein